MLLDIASVDRAAMKRGLLRVPREELVAVVNDDNLTSLSL